MSEPILIGVGSTQAQMLPVQVLSYSLTRHTERPLEIVPLFRSGIEIPMPRDPRNAARTPFSFQRFLLPELGGFRRRAVYLDSDMIAFADIGELYDQPMDGADILAVEATPGRQALYSVLVVDPSCGWRVDELVGGLDNGELSYEELIFDFKVPGRVAIRLPYRWNSLERFEPGETSILHFTDMWTQPWLVKANPLTRVWVEELLGAIEHGFVTTDFVAECVRKRWIRPSLLYQVEHGVADPADLPWWILAKDLPFTRHCRREGFRIF